MKGVGFDLLWPEIAAMGLWGSLPFVLSGGRFRKSLD